MLAKRIIPIVLLAAIMVVLAASAVSAQGPVLPTPVPAAKNPTATSPAKVAPAAVPATPTTAPIKLPATPTKSAAVAPKAPAINPQSGARGLFPNYSAGFQVQNLSSAAVANITMTYYNQDGTTGTASPVPDTIPANSSHTYVSLPVASGFNGSVVVSSDQPVASVVNVSGNNSTVWAAYDGSSTGSTSVSIPLLMKNNFGFYTWFNVQNAGSAPTTASVAYSDGTTASATIAPGASKTFSQQSETHPVTVFSAVVTSSGGVPIVGTVMQEDPATLGAYSAFPAGATNPVLPLINANNYGYVTGAQIQNIGGSSTTVTVSYTPSAAGSACTETQTIAAGTSKTFALNAFTYAPQTAGTTCVLGATFVGSARVTANSASMPLVALVSQLLPGSNGEIYGGFNPTTATNKVVFPLIMDRNFGYNTGFNVMNVGGASTAVSCTFTGSAYTVGATLAAGQALTDVQTNKIANAYVGSATCTAGAGGQIVGVVNELSSAAGDQLLVYEGINN